MSCVGHETDFTIADFAADLRAPTPSAAAELAVPEIAGLEAEIDSLILRAGGAMDSLLRFRRAQLDRLSAPLSPRSLKAALTGPKAAALEALSVRLDAAKARALEKKRHELTVLERTLSTLDPAAVLSRGYAVVEQGGKAQSDILPLHGAITVRMRDGSREALLTEKEEP